MPRIAAIVRRGKHTGDRRPARRVVAQDRARQRHARRERAVHRLPVEGARCSGITEEQSARALRVLESTGQIAFRDGHWVRLPSMAVTTGRNPATLGILTRAWTQVALERMEKRGPAHFGYSLFAVSRADLRRLRDLQLEYLREMQTIIAQSSPNECVGLLCLHLLDLRPGDGNALSTE